MSRWTGILGGEAASRSLLGGHASKARRIGLIVVIVAALSLLQLLGLWAAVGGAVGIVVVMVATMEVSTGSLWSRRARRQAWKAKTKAGLNNFVPYDQQVWDDLMARKGTKEGRQDPQVIGYIAAMREMPDAVEGMRWLQEERGVPGIAWHTPTGEQSYLSVTWEVAGQLRGLVSQNTINSASASFAHLLSGWGGDLELPGAIQVTTRIQPMDMALHEQWLMDHLDPDAPEQLLRSYQGVLRQVAAQSMRQRHLVTVSWPITDMFTARAAQNAKGLGGWRMLMNDQIHAVDRSLRQAQFLDVRVRSARQVSAIFRHMQHPDFEFDRVGDVTTTNCWLPSHEDRPLVTVAGVDPNSGSESTWLHHTGRIDHRQLHPIENDGLWMAPMLTAFTYPLVRTLSTHIKVYPAEAARGQADLDATSDRSEKRERQQKGQIDDSEINMHVSASTRRRQDLAVGNPWHGATWAAYLTISARNREELRAGRDRIADAARHGSGIKKIEWLDGVHAAAMGATWPTGRGLGPTPVSLNSRFRAAVTGTGDKDTL